jgi:Rrf2 family protein
MSAELIAMHADLPAKFLEAIIVELRRAEIVKTQRGPRGGCVLARPPELVTVADIVEAIDGPIGTVRGEAPELLLYPEAAQPLKRVWTALASDLRGRLSGVTLADLVQQPPVDPSVHG